MKKSEFKQMIKESVKEVLVEEGVLKSVISEVVKAVGIIQLEQTPATTQQSFSQEANKETAEKHRQKLAESKQKMIDAIGKSSFGGVDIFEGTTPMKKGGNPQGTGTHSSALEGVDPGDSGVDISSLLGGSNVWKQLLK
jgi:hypothetical protein|tara:strand:+ start:380 stop:796 length:417 start_codon:yes stop_codon:yes gene_type:complete